jgi:hypothetical protein
MEESVPQRIYDCIEHGEGEGMCDDCIQSELDLTNRNQVTQVTSTLAVTPLFNRYHDLCEACGRGKLVITRANRK